MLDHYEKKLRRYYSPHLKAQDKLTPPDWADGSDKSGKRFASRKDMLFELDAQVSHVHANVTKVKRDKAVQRVLNTWKLRMNQYSFTDQDGAFHCIKLLPTLVALCFQQAAGQKKDIVQLKVGKSVNGIRHGDLFGNAKDFLRVFKSHAY